MEFSRQEYSSGLPFLFPPGELPDPGIEPMSPVAPALTGGFFTAEPPGKPQNVSPKLPPYPQYSHPGSWSFSIWVSKGHHSVHTTGLAYWSALLQRLTDEEPSDGGDVVEVSLVGRCVCQGRFETCSRIWSQPGGECWVLEKL